MEPDNVFDRHPQICAAGKPVQRLETVKDRLKSFPLEDQIAALKHEAKIPDKEPPLKYKLPPIENRRHKGIFVESYRLFIPKVKSRFQTMINDLKETPYQSYWTQTVGTTADTVGKLPCKIDPKTTTFGKKIVRECTMKELINPNRSIAEIEKEYAAGQKLYKKTHNDFMLREQRSYNYLSPPFNPKHCYGGRTGYDKRGIWLQNIMHTKTIDKFTISDSLQSDFQADNTSFLGKVRTRNKIEQMMPDGYQHCYGSPATDTIGVAALLTENSTSQLKIHIDGVLHFINVLRRILKDRFNKRLLSFDDLNDSFLYYDKEKSGWIPFDLLREVCECHKVNWDVKDMKNFLILMDIYKDDKVNYRKFIKYINWQKDFPDLGKTYEAQPEKQYYSTEYREMLEDMKAEVPQETAGVPSIRFDLMDPLPSSGCRVDCCHLGSETVAGTIINPSIYTSYGLSYRDFFCPRDKQQMKNLFIKIGYVFDDEQFEKYWQEGLEIDKTGLVCVETFQNLLEKYNVTYDKDTEKPREVVPSCTNGM